MTHNLIYNRNLISIDDLKLEHIDLIFKTAKKFKEAQGKQSFTHLLNNKVIASCFFEPSTRTRLSFEAAALRSGAQMIGFSDDSSLSIQKGETLSDTMRVISNYADLIVIRHPKEGSARLTADVAECPVINAGDGSNQHPTQALIDLFSMLECQTRIDGLSIGLVGDLKYGRAIHSFTQLCSLFDVRLYLVSPEMLSLPDALCDNLKKRSIRFSFHQTLEEIIPKLDILYMIRIQQERFNSADYQLIKHQFTLTEKMLDQAKSNLKILHPLPRVKQIDINVDRTPYAYYFQQASNGVPIRQALLNLILNEELP
jgi:aspartate carbamoyltransferase catalytic subunit